MLFEGEEPRLPTTATTTQYCHDANNNNNNNVNIINNNINNKKADKYSLRPRSSRKRTHSPDSHQLEQDHELDVKCNNLKRSQRKQKSAPLSKYRRKTANARERSRMREINQAFEALRKAVPQSTPQPANEKLTKITTLRLAMKYISTLSAVLNGENDLLSAYSDCSELDYCSLFLESDGESLPPPALNTHSDFSDHSGDFSSTTSSSISAADFNDHHHNFTSLSVDDFSPLSSPIAFDRLSSHFDPFFGGDFS